MEANDQTEKAAAEVCTVTDWTRKCYLVVADDIAVRRSIDGWTTDQLNRSN